MKTLRPLTQLNGSWQKTFLWDYERLGNKLMFFPLPAEKKLCGTAVNESSARTKEKKELRLPFPTLFTEKR